MKKKKKNVHNDTQQQWIPILPLALNGDLQNFTSVHPGHWCERERHACLPRAPRSFLELVHCPLFFRKIAETDTMAPEV